MDLLLNDSQALLLTSRKAGSRLYYCLRTRDAKEFLIPFHKDKSSTNQQDNDDKDAEDDREMSMVVHFVVAEFSFVTRQTLAARDFIFYHTVSMAITVLDVTGSCFFDWKDRVVFVVGARG